MHRSRTWIAGELRRRIAAGVYPPGSRMPSHRELIEELGVSSATLQLAFDLLVSQGFVEPRGAAGTRVADPLPSAAVIALVFPDEIVQGNWNRFMGSVHTVGASWQGDGVRFRSYPIAGSDPASAAHRRLCADVADGALAGVVFVNPPFYLPDSPVLAAAIPRVVFSSGGARDVRRYRASVASFNGDAARDDLLRRFAERGCRRIAGLTGLGVQDDVLRDMRNTLRTLDLETRPEWWVGLPVEAPAAACAQSVARLLCSGPERYRPDALLIADDNLVPYAAAGIQDAGVRVPQDLMIAAHANFPMPSLCPLPSLRFGPDLRQLLRCAIDEIARLRQGLAPQAHRIPYVVHDVAAVASAQASR